MTKEEFARHLRFSSWKELMDASQEVKYKSGALTYCITQLPEGQWAVWNNSEIPLDPDRVMHFIRKEEAENFIKETFSMLDEILGSLT